MILLCPRFDEFSGQRRPPFLWRPETFLEGNRETTFQEH